MLTSSIRRHRPDALRDAGGARRMVAEAFRQHDERMPIGGLGIIGLVGAAAASRRALEPQRVELRRHRPADNFGLFVTLVLVVVGHPDDHVLVAGRRARRLPAGEYYALMLFAIAGMMHDGDGERSAGHLHRARDPVARRLRADRHPARRSRASTEAAFKYFLLGAFSSAFFLYGIAFTFGAHGQHAPRPHRRRIARRSRCCTPRPMLLLALGLLLVGFAFKISAVPFHMWTPDAYEGAPTIVTGFMSTGVKAAAFAAFARVFLSAFEPFSARLGARRLGRLRRRR